MKNLILGAMLLFSITSFGQITFKTKWVSINKNPNTMDNTFTITDSTFVTEATGAFTKKVFKKQGIDPITVLKIKFKVETVNNQKVYTYLEDNLRITIFNNADKWVVKRESKDTFTNQITECLYY